MGAVDRHPAAAGFRALVTRLVDDNGPGGRARAMFNMGLGLLIFVNVATVILESVEPLRERFEFWFLLSEQVATGVFAIEYCLRVWTSIDLREAPSRHPIWGRLAYMRGPLPLIDLVAVLPALIGLFGAADLRVLRLMRLMRMLKLTRRLQIFNLLGAVIRDEARSILALLFVMVLVVTMSGALMYMLEAEAQPSLFNSIPAAMWWAIETLTTVGYGDMVPITMPGRVLGGAVAVVGIGTFAVFSGLITIGFFDELRKRREQMYAPREGACCPHCGRALEAIVER